MRLKFTLIAFLFVGVLLNAQDTIDYLIITETRLDNTNFTYLELTNVGTEPVQLSDFHIGHWGGGSTLDLATGQTPDEDFPIPVDTLLQPGESFLFATVQDFAPRKFAEGDDEFSEKLTQDNMLEELDFPVYIAEARGDETDSITPGISRPFTEQWGPGMNGFYLEYHFPNGDSIVVDQVCGMFTGEGGENLNRTQGDGYDVAGVEKGTGTHYLIRNAKVTSGNLDFASGRGLGLDDSEWIPIPIYGGPWRMAPWTIGNHGNYQFDENTLVSEVIGVDLANKVLTLPWGIRRGDDIMSYFENRPGIGWEYLVGTGTVEDSLTWAARTGDQFVLYVCGESLYRDTFDIVVEAPAANANMVVPVSNEDPDGNWRDIIENGIMAWPRITQNESGNDTIWGYQGGIPYATRIDSLYERLEKPSNAAWEIVYASGIEKPDLSNGDKLKVTAENESAKEYHISMLPYLPSDNANLSSITWPDIPEFFRGLFGWIGDTIPNFNPEVYNYTIQVPLITDGIPAFVAKTMDLNAEMETDRPASLGGGPAERTLSYTVTAEDETTVNEYNILLNKEINPDNVQPFSTDPFISEIIINDGWQGNDYLEVFNPGNQTLDLSNYMFVGTSSSDVTEAISADNADDWMMRYEKYIPGFKWQDSLNWPTQPYIAEPDLSVNKIVQPGDVFTMAMIRNTNSVHCRSDYTWPAATQTDVHFQNFEGCYIFENQWGEEIADAGTPFSKFQDNTVFLFKIVNDSIKEGLKAATDPNDFELLDIISMGDGSVWKLGDTDRPKGSPFTLIRKPPVWYGNPQVKGSFGTTLEDAEWEFIDRSLLQSQGFGWPWNILNVLNDYGKHYMVAPTHFMSTVGSLVYIVSEGYSLAETIRGVTTGTTVEQLYPNLIKADTAQAFTATSTADGSVLAMDAALSNNDTLTVISADSTNVTKYILEVTESGLSSDALLTSSTYTVEVTVQPTEGAFGEASVGGFEYGTQLKTVIENVTVPVGASMSIISEEGSYVPYKILNFDTAYVDAAVSTDIYLEVVAEDGVTGITYQLTPDYEEGDLFVTSNLFNVDQSALLIELMPAGLGVESFLSYLTPSPGATISVIDKAGYDRVDGLVAADDKVVVTSADEASSVVYFVSQLSVSQNLFLAYILSDVFSIDQVSIIINGVTEGETVEGFVSKVELSTGASMMVTDADGNEKTSGDLALTDQVVVNSGDGTVQVTYTFSEFIVSAKPIEIANIELYPNPSGGMLNIRGVEPGQAIHIYNAYGARVVEVEVTGSLERIAINEHPAGVYMIVVLDQKHQLIGKYKAVKY